MLFVAGIGGGFAWIDDRPNDLTWMLRIGFAILGLVSIAIFLKIHFRRDDVPDYLHKLSGGYFDRGGFCFAIVASKLNGTCFFDAYFQNKYDHPCTGQIVLRPGKAFFGSRADMDMIAYRIDCPAAAFGVARLPVPIPSLFKAVGRSSKSERRSTTQAAKAKCSAFATAK